MIAKIPARIVNIPADSNGFVNKIIAKIITIKAFNSIIHLALASRCALKALNR